MLHSISALHAFINSDRYFHIFSGVLGLGVIFSVMSIFLALLFDNEKFIIGGFFFLVPGGSLLVFFFLNTCLGLIISH